MPLLIKAKESRMKVFLQRFQRDKGVNEKQKCAAPMLAVDLQDATCSHSSVSSLDSSVSSMEESSSINCADAFLKHYVESRELSFAASQPLTSSMARPPRQQRRSTMTHSAVGSHVQRPSGAARPQLRKHGSLVTLPSSQYHKRPLQTTHGVLTAYESIANRKTVDGRPTRPAQSLEEARAALTKTLSRRRLHALVPPPPPPPPSRLTKTMSCRTMPGDKSMPLTPSRELLRKQQSLHDIVNAYDCIESEIAGLRPAPVL